MNRLDRALNNPFSLPKAREDYMRHRLTAKGNGAIRPNMKKGAFLLLCLATSALSGCVQVAAPDKPIVINLNIAIRQEVLYRLDQSSKKVIEENAEIF